MKMFKLLENELDILFFCLSQAYICTKNVETLSDYILENDDKTKYILEVINLVEEFSQEVFNMGLRIEMENEQIKKMKAKIVDLF